MFDRKIKSNIINSFHKKKAVIIYGARQVGKTTLVKDIMGDKFDSSIYLNCDEPDIRESLTNVTSTKLKELFGNNKYIFIDEAQRVKNIGITLKIAIDSFEEYQIVATGSSALELSNNIMEPLTGRAFEFKLYPLSLNEMSQKYTKLEYKRILEDRIIYGSYPDIVNYPKESEKRLSTISNNYLYKDLLQFQEIRNSELLEKLIKSLALQIGNEVSFSELGNKLDAAKQTIERYIKLLEQSFIIFRLNPFSRNLRSELTKKCKIYFYDTGIRNSLVNNFNPLEIRNDVGALWENYIISEKIKRNTNLEIFANLYFWRTHQQQEIDLIEEKNGILTGYEMKFNKDKFRIPLAFSKAYPDTGVKLINKDNFMDEF
jgi:predicted AAA+ superfamily ATPase